MEGSRIQMQIAYLLWRLGFTSMLAWSSNLKRSSPSNGDKKKLFSIDKHVVIR